MKELIEIQSELNAPKNQRNTFGNYNYRSCEDILEAVKPLLLKQKCVLTISDEVVEVGGRVYVKATATLTNSEGKQTATTAYAREADSRKGMDPAQLSGATSSYSRKYCLGGLFCIDDTKDADATNDHGKSTATKDKPKETTEKAADDSERMSPEQKRKIWGIAIGIWGGKREKGEKLSKEEMNLVRGHLERMCIGPEWDLNRLTVKQADTMIETLKSMEGDDIPW